MPKQIERQKEQSLLSQFWDQWKKMCEILMNEETQKKLQKRFSIFVPKELHNKLKT